MEKMTGKEFAYIADSMMNEDLLLKQCTVGFSSLQIKELQQLCTRMGEIHGQHFTTLLQKLEEYEPSQPTQP